MFYPELKDLKYKFNEKFITELDSWLAFLSDDYKDKIIPSDLSTTFGIDYSIIEVILNDLVSKNILRENFLIICPECGREIKISDINNILRDAKDINYCTRCDSSIVISKRDIYSCYKLIKDPSASEEEIRKYAYRTLSIKSEPTRQSNLLDYLENKKGKINDFFFIRPLNLIIIN